MKIECTYAMNYNGFAMQVNGEDCDDERFVAIEDAVLSYAVDFCDEDGYFEGDIAEVERVCKNAVSQQFGVDFEFIFEADGQST